MNLENGIELLESWRILLAELGVTPTVLVGAGLLFVVALVVTFREVLGWYLKVHQLQDELRSVRQHLAEIEAQLIRLNQRSASSIGDVEAMAPLEKETAPTMARPSSAKAFVLSERKTSH